MDCSIIIMGNDFDGIRNSLSDCQFLSDDFHKSDYQTIAKKLPKKTNLCNVFSTVKELKRVKDKKFVFWGVEHEFCVSVYSDFLKYYDVNKFVEKVFQDLDYRFFVVKVDKQIISVAFVKGTSVLAKCSTQTDNSDNIRCILEKFSNKPFIDYICNNNISITSQQLMQFLSNEIIRLSKLDEQSLFLNSSWFDTYII